MSSLQTPQTRNGAADPNSPVPLDTIPISPAKDTDPTNVTEEDSKQPSAKPAKAGDDPVTVFHDPEHFNVKHPLMNEWTLWFTKPSSGKARPNPSTFFYH